MENDSRRENLTTATAALGNPSHHFVRRLKINGGLSSISSLPDEILHQILSLIPTKLAITTSLLSKRWRHVWRETPCLSFDWFDYSYESIRKTLASYAAAKITGFRLCTNMKRAQLNRLIEFAMSHNVETLDLEVCSRINMDSFFRCSSLRQLIVYSRRILMVPECIVSWTSLRNLSLTYCKLSDASFSKIVSGSPMLESLTLKYVDSLEYLDLSKLMRLRRLDIFLSSKARDTMEIVAPQINSLRLRNLRLENNKAQSICTLVDVKSLTEANIEFFKTEPSTWCNATDTLKTGIHTMVQKLENVENLTLGVSFLQILSIAVVRGVLFPTFMVKSLTLETRILRSVVPCIARLLQNSPELKKVTLYSTDFFNKEDKCVKCYLDKQDLNSDQCWRFKGEVSLDSWEGEFAEPKLVGSFVELLLANTKTLETLVLRLGSYFNRSRLKEFSEITHTLSHDNNFSILIK